MAPRGPGLLPPARPAGSGSGAASLFAKLCPGVSLSPDRAAGRL